MSDNKGIKELATAELGDSTKPDEHAEEFYRILKNLEENIRARNYLNGLMCLLH